MFELGLKEIYNLLPFRALEGNSLPAALERRWEVAIAASRAAEWRLWFTTLDQAQQQARVQMLAERTKQKFWTGLCPVYEEWSKRRHTRFVLAAARALPLLKHETGRIQLLGGKVLAMFVDREVSQMRRELQTPTLALVPPEMPHDVAVLRVRLAPSYFRLPANAFRFATQIFSGKSYGEAVAEQKANFNSWAVESQVCRVDGHPDYVVWKNALVHKDVAARLALKAAKKREREKLRAEKEKLREERRRRKLEREKLREELRQTMREEEEMGWEDMEEEEMEDEEMDEEEREQALRDQELRDQIRAQLRGVRLGPGGIGVVCDDD